MKRFALNPSEYTTLQALVRGEHSDGQNSAIIALLWLRR